MHECSKKLGVGRFGQFADSCADAEVQKQMEQCKADVEKSFGPGEQREGFKGEYALHKRGGDCCRKGGNVGNKKPCKSQAKCQEYCDRTAACKFYSFSKKYKNCNLCSACKISNKGNAKRYDSYKLKEPDGEEGEGQDEQQAEQADEPE